MGKWEIKRIYVPMHIYEAHKFTKETTSSGVQAIPAFGENTHQAWHEAEALAASGWEPFAAVPITGGAFAHPGEGGIGAALRVAVSGVENNVVYSPTAGVWLLFRRES
jgi:hypothetical protein